MSFTENIFQCLHVIIIRFIKILDSKRFIEIIDTYCFALAKLASKRPDSVSKFPKITAFQKNYFLDKIKKIFYID